MFLSLPLRKFNCKDNIKGEQKLSTPILFNLKLWRILRIFFTIRPKYSRWKRRDTEIFAVGLARKRTCTGFADKHCKPTREGFAVHSHATKFPLSGKRNFPYTGISRSRCIAYRKRRCHRCGVRGVFFLRRLRKRQADDFRLCKFFAAFVFAETVATAAHAGCLNGED